MSEPLAVNARCILVEPPYLPALGGCLCYWKPPTIPVYRGTDEHLPDCPAKNSGHPVGAWPVDARPTLWASNGAALRSVQEWNLYAEAVRELRRVRPDGAALVAEERRRQIEQEGWTLAHDVTHTAGELAKAAACYAVPPAMREYSVGRDETELWAALWPFGTESWKPTPQDRIRELVKAGALIAAEIDRLQRRYEVQEPCRGDS